MGLSDSSDTREMRPGVWQSGSAIQLPSYIPALAGLNIAVFQSGNHFPEKTVDMSTICYLTVIRSEVINVTDIDSTEGSQGPQ